MKFAIFAILCVVLVNAETLERTWGDVHKTELGRELVYRDRTDNKYTTYTFTYPRAPTDKIIVGIKLIDNHPPTKVEFVKGKLGDHQITLKVTAEGHSLDSTFIFYTNHY